jgi:transposase-like protein
VYVLYNILGIEQNGRKEVLGFYLAESEGANFWLVVLNDLKERGVEDILITCVDGLKSFPATINSVFPNAEVQLCVVHQIRNSLKYVSSKDVKIFMNDLKKVYQASSREIAENYLIIGNFFPVISNILPLSGSQFIPHTALYCTESDDTRCCNNTICPPEDWHVNARNMSRIVV